MAQIRQYVSEESPYAEIGGRNANASDFGGGQGAAFGDLGSNLAQAGERIQVAQEQADVSDVHVKLAQARAKWTTELTNRAQTDDVNNPDFADKFTQDFHNDAATIGDGVATKAGQRAFQEGLANQAASFAESSGVYQAQAAGVKAKQDYMTYLNTNQLTLFHDPSQFGSVLKDAQAALDNPAGPYARLPASAREALGRTGANELAKSAMMGMIDADPVTAKKELEAGLSPVTKALDADSLTTLLRHADQQIDAARVDAARVDEMQRRQAADARDNTLNGFIGKMVTDPTSVSAKDVVNSDLKPEQKIAVMGWIQKGLTGDGDKNQQDAIFNDLFARAHLPDGDPDKITDPDVLNDYVSSGSIRMEQLNVLRGEIGGKGTDADNAEKSMKNGLVSLAESSLVVKDPISGFLDPGDQEGHSLLYKFTSWFLPEYDKRRAAGKTPEQLLTPGSPDYMGGMIDTLRSQRKQFPGLSTGPTGLLAPDAATPGGAAPAAASKIDVSKATRTGTAKNGKVYEIDGKWVYGDGSAYQ